VYVPGVVPGATVIVPLGFIVIEPAAGVGAVPGVRLAFVPAPLNTTGWPLVVSLPITDGVVPPVDEIVVGPSLTASIVGLTGVVIVGVQRAVAGQVGSPPPLTLALLVTLGVAAAVGVTGIVKLVLPLAARPAATVQVTV